MNRRKWLIFNSWRNLVIYEIAILYKAILYKATFRVETTVQKFKATIFPFNLDLFPDHLYQKQQTIKTEQQVKISEEQHSWKPLTSTEMKSFPSTSRWRSCAALSMSKDVDYESNFYNMHRILIMNQIFSL